MIQTPIIAKTSSNHKIDREKTIHDLVKIQKEWDNLLFSLG